MKKQMGNSWMGGKITTRLDISKADKAKPAKPLTTPAKKQQTKAKPSCIGLNSVAAKIELRALSITCEEGSGSSTHCGFFTD